MLDGGFGVMHRGFWAVEPKAIEHKAIGQRGLNRTKPLEISLRRFLRLAGCIGVAVRFRLSCP